MNTQFVFQSKPVAIALCLALLMALTGCIVEPLPRRVYVEPAPRPVVVEDDLIYYPDYEVYYDPGAHFYWYMQGGEWVTGRVVPGISVDVLLHAPAVRMNFHDSPAYHHGEVVRRYPRGWRPPP